MKTTNMTTKNTASKGFTLVELMVVITIIAILAVAGLTLFTNATRNARDSKRVQDVKAMASAMEQHYIASGTNVVCLPGAITASSGQYCPMYGGHFNTGFLPADPQSGNAYCVYDIVASGGALTTPVAATWVTATAQACPALAGTTGTVVTNTMTSGVMAGPIPAVAHSRFEICALLENSGTPTPFCVSSSQGG